MAVTGKYGTPMSRASSELFQTIGIASSLPTMATGTIGTPAHRDLDEATAAEPLELVAVARELAGRLGAFGEREHELLLVVQQSERVVGMRGDATGACPQRADHGDPPEQVVGESVHRAPSSVSTPCMITGASEGMAPP